MTIRKLAMWSAFLSLLGLLPAQEPRHVQQRTASGVIEGIITPDGKVRVFKGIPYAAPPVGPLRWKAPQPVAPWTGVRPALEFGPRPMQGRIFDDMVFRDQGPSEDCLYLNVWIPEHHATGKLPVMVWIFGGGFVAGGSSEPRQDGTLLCQEGVIVVSMNYRLGVFGFFAHPELTQESGHNASGNYGLLDQVAALQWVRANIAGFGGDPDNVTAFGESAGSYSVSAMVATPLTRGLVHKAIGESGALFSATRPTPSLAEAEKSGAEWAQTAFGTASLADLRAKPAQELLDATLSGSRRWFGACIDGVVLPASSAEIYGAGRQAHIPLLAGWNRDEGGAQGYFENEAPTRENFVSIARRRFGERAEDFLKVYAADTDEEAKRAAADYAGDNFIAYSTWKWIELHRQTGASPVYRYLFEQTLPLASDAKPSAEPITPHAADIEFVFRALPSRHLPWRPQDHAVSEMMAAYWTNFAKTGNPNGGDLPRWPAYEEKTGFPVMHLQAHAKAAPDAHRARYLFLDAGLK